MPVSQQPRTISVVIPTVSGREDHLNFCIDAYERTSPADVEIIVIHDEHGCGAAWVKGVAQARGAYLHLSADDLEPLDGWWQAALQASDRGRFPAAVIFDPFGGLESAGLSDDTLLRVAVDGAPVQASGVPFMSRGWWEESVDEQALAELHYSTDLLMSHWMAAADHPVTVSAGYAFRHHWAQPGRQGMERLNADFARYREIVAAAA